MDPRPFQSRPVETQRPGFAVFLATLARAACGAILFWLVPRRLAPGYPIAAGWVGMIGLLLILHFGCFELLALLWRRAGVDVRSIMQAPLRARSLSDFWSSRWNSAFRDLAHRFVLRPMTGFVGVPGAVLATYLASGLLHELVISVPARAAYGQPTAYFLFQGLGVRFERSRVGRRLHLNRGLAGRLFALLCVAVPAYWLFHPPFVLHVFVPFMRALRALG
jgi:D-alanyl-lipoteichoic acid acyltransferase DltB (MBOAT superfamily)